MSRSFLTEPVDRAVLERCINLGSRAPSAGKSQGWHLVMLEGSDTGRYWDIALPAERRHGFAFPGLLRAPIILIVCADPTAYLDRYSEPDKKSTGLGESLDKWPAPYWTVDASFATMTMLLALENEGLGALFFAHAAAARVRQEFAIPDVVEILGVVAVGHVDQESLVQGRSASRERRSVDGIIHSGRW